jgi:hypothetical protein
LRILDLIVYLNSFPIPTFVDVFMRNKATPQNFLGDGDTVTIERSPNYPPSSARDVWYHDCDARTIGEGGGPDLTRIMTISLNYMEEGLLVTGAKEEYARGANAGIGCDTTSFDHAE